MLSVELSPIEAIRTHFAVEKSIEGMRKFCRNTDAQFGDMNNLHRDAIADMKSISAKMLVVLREAGWPMDSADIQDDPIDELI